MSPARAPRILLVDDDPTMLMLCGRYLRKRFPGAQIVEAGSGEEALERISNDPFDLVLSDLRMGPTSGIDVLAAALEHAPTSHRVLMSGYGDPTTIEAANARAKVHAFLEKPVSTSEMREALERFVVAPFLARGSESDGANVA